jgi:hypothetical protein
MLVLKIAMDDRLLIGGALFKAVVELQCACSAPLAHRRLGFVPPRPRRQSRIP